MNKILNREDCFLYGHIRKALGFKGAVKVVREDDKALKQEDITFFFLGLEDGLVPFHVEECHETGGLSLEVKFTDVNSVEATVHLLNIPVYLSLDYLADAKAPSNLDEEAFIGLKVKDEKLGLLGVVSDIVHFSHQSLLRITREGKEILVPVVPEIILDVDFKKKTIRVELPEGLVELNT